MKRLITSMAIAAAAIAATPAMAVTYTIGAPNSGPVDVTSQFAAGYKLYDFNNGVTPFTGGAIVNTDNAPFYARPAGDTTPYFSTGPSTSSPATFAISGITKVSFYWGSIDSFNSVSFLGIPGATFGGSLFDGDDSARNARQVTFNLTSAEAAALTGIALSSTQNAFEIDNLVVGNAVPEPATYGIMSLGLGMVGAVLRRRRKTSAAGAFSFA